MNKIIVFLGITLMVAQQNTAAADDRYPEWSQGENGVNCSLYDEPPIKNEKIEEGDDSDSADFVRKMYRNQFRDLVNSAKFSSQYTDVTPALCRALEFAEGGSLKPADLNVDLSELVHIQQKGYRIMIANCLKAFEEHLNEKYMKVAEKYAHMARIDLNNFLNIEKVILEKPSYKFASCE